MPTRQTTLGDRSGAVGSEVGVVNGSARSVAPANRRIGSRSTGRGLRTIAKQWEYPPCHPSMWDG